MKRLLLTLAATLAATLVPAQIPFAIPDVIPSPVPSAIPGGGGSAPLKWTTAPTDQSVNEAAELAFSVAAKSGGQTVTYAIGANDSGTVNAATGAYTWTPSYVAAGTYTVTFTATAGGKTLSRAINVTVHNVDITLVGSVTDSVWATNLTGATVMAVGVDTATVDGDGNYSLTLGDPGVYTIVATHTADYDTITVTDTTITAPVTRNILIATYGQHVKGAITTNTTWSRSNNPLGWYRVDGNVTVNGNVLLTIEPGVDVKFDSAATITASATNARIRAIGTAVDSIRFIPGIASAWRGLIITAAPSAGDSLKFCRISGSIKVSWAGYGGGLLAHANLPVDHCTISGNSLTAAHGTGGGGVSGGIITNCLITNNACSGTGLCGGGGGGGARGSKLINCIITNNSDGPGTSGGGGVNACTVTDCIISGNTGWYGGGSYGGTLTNCIISGNTSTHSIGYGGGVYSSTVINCTISNNTGNEGGGAWNSSIINCIISGNVASGHNPHGAGVFGGPVVNCLVYGNRMGKSTEGGWRYGGGSERATLSNCTFFNNSAIFQGDQIYSTGQTIKNTIAWQKDSTSYFTIADSGAASVSYSNIWRTSGTYGTVGCINSQPLFVDSTRNDAIGWLLKPESVGIAADANYRDMGIGFGHLYKDYRSWRPMAWGQNPNTYLALPGANLDSAITYRIEGTIGTATHPTYDAYTGLFTWTPEEGDIGTYPFKFWAKSGTDSVSKPDTLIVERGYTALSFDGGDFSRFDNRNIANAARNALTVATWIYVDTTCGDAGVFWGKGRTADSDLEWQIRFRKSAPCSLRFVLSGDGTTQAFSSLKWTDNKSKWQHVAMTYAAGVCSIYVNGVLAATDVDATSPAWPAALYAGSGNLTVGAADYSSSTTGYNCAKGRLAMPTAYASGLTSAQIAALYAGTYAGGESMKLTRTNGTTTAGTTWYDDAGDDGLNGESGAIPGLRGHYALWPIAGDTDP